MSSPNSRVGHWTILVKTMRPDPCPQAGAACSSATFSSERPVVVRVSLAGYSSDGVEVGTVIRARLHARHLIAGEPLSSDDEDRGRASCWDRGRLNRSSGHQSRAIRAPCVLAERGRTQHNSRIRGGRAQSSGWVGGEMLSPIESEASRRWRRCVRELSWRAAGRVGCAGFGSVGASVRCRQARR